MKRFLSILIAAVMIISMLPTIAFATTEGVKSEHYIFNLAALGKTDVANVKFVNYEKSVANYGEYSGTHNTTSYPSMWTFVGHTNMDAGAMVYYNASDASATADMSIKHANLISNIANTAAYAFKIKVRESGIYSPEFVLKTRALAQGNPGLKADVYVVDADYEGYSEYNITGVSASGLKDAIENAPAGSKIGQINTADFDSSAGKTETLNNVTLEQGDYYLIFHIVGYNADVYARNQAEADKGTAKYPRAYSIMMHRATFTEAPPKALTVSPESVSVTVGETATITSRVTDSAEAEMPAAKVTYTSASDAVATVDANGTITGVAAGNTTITASVVGYPNLDKTIAVEVKEVPKVVSADYVFKPTVLDPSATTNIAFKDYVNPGTYYSTFDTTASDRWAWVGMRYFNGYYTDIKTDTVQLSIRKSDIAGRIGNAGCALKIEVPENGIYKSKIYFTSMVRYPGMKSNIYLVKADTGAFARYNLTDNGISNAIVRLNNDQLVGEVDTDTGKDEANVEVSFAKELKLEKGDYYLFFKPSGYKEHPENTTFTSYMLAINSFSITKTGEYTPNTTNDVDPNVSFGAAASIPEAAITTSVDGYVAGNVADLARGTEITVTAPTVEGYTFCGWRRGSGTGKIENCVSETSSYTFELVTNTYLTAVYDEVAEAGDADSKVVEFWNEDGKYYTKLTAGADNKLAALPANPELIGKQFSKWCLSKTEELTTDTVLTEAVTRAVAEYTDDVVTGVKFASESVGDLSYGQSITLSAPAGETAQYWMRDGKVVHYGSSYTYHAWDATEITYSTDPILWEPIVVLDDYANGAFMIEYNSASVAQSYELVEVGILLNSTPDFDVDSCGAKVTSQRNDNHGQLSVAVDPGTYARGYMIYKEAGKYRIIYSDNVVKAE